VRVEPLAAGLEHDSAFGSVLATLVELPATSCDPVRFVELLEDELARTKGGGRAEVDARGCDPRTPTTPAGGACEKRQGLSLHVV
jgi:hypothetical protein